MLAGNADKHDGLTDLQCPHAVDDGHPLQRPALMGLIDDLLQ